jgi:serine/threonine protein kinase
MNIDVLKSLERAELDMLRAFIRKTKIASMPISLKARYPKGVTLISGPEHHVRSQCQVFKPLGDSGVIIKKRVMPPGVIVPDFEDDASGAPSAESVIFDELVLMHRCCTGGHPHVVNLKGCVWLEVRRELFIETEECVETVRDLLVKGCGKLPTKMIQRVMRHTLCGLQHLHANDVLHCDIKIDNLFVAHWNGNPEDWIVKIGDFGAAQRVLGGVIAAERAGGVAPNYNVNGAGYKPPETLLGVPYGRGVDVWAVGCCLATMADATCAPFKFRARDGVAPIAREDDLDHVLQMMGGLPTGVIQKSTPGWGPAVPLADRTPDAAFEHYFGYVQSTSRRAFALLRLLLHPDPILRLGVEGALSDPYLINVRNKRRK